MIEEALLIKYKPIILLVSLLNFPSSPVLTRSVSQRTFWLKESPVRGPTRLGAGWHAPTELSCAVSCMEQYEECWSFMYNPMTELCTPGSFFETRQPLPSAAEGSLYHSIRCQFGGFRMFTRGNTEACIGEFGPANYSDADARCRSMNGFLMSVKTEDTFLIMMEGSNADTVWIGCDDLDHDGTFIWREDDEVLSADVVHNLFDDNMPTSDCVIHNASWLHLSSDNCSLSLNYFCEISLP